VTVACVASVCRDSPPTLALDRKLESHSACSPGGRGGISAGGEAGSNVRLAKTASCLSMVGPGVSRGCPDWLRRPIQLQPKISAPNNTQSMMDRRQVKDRLRFRFLPAAHFGESESFAILRRRQRRNHEFMGGGWAKGTEIEICAVFRHRLDGARGNCSGCRVVLASRLSAQPRTASGAPSSRQVIFPLRAPRAETRFGVPRVRPRCSAASD
jgi:hypothetical protein